MDLSHLAFFAVVAAALLGLVALRYLSARGRAGAPGEEALERAVDIADAKEGASNTIIGRVAPPLDTLDAPLSHRKCVAWTVSIEESFVTQSDFDTQGRQRTGAWRTILHDQKTLDFEVNDDTGRAHVRAGYPELTLVGDKGWQAWPLEEAPVEVVAFLRSHGQRAIKAHGETRQLRAREGILEAGERVLVAGLAAREIDPDAAQHGGYRQSATRLVIVKPPDETLVVTDDFDRIRRHGLRRF